LWDKDPNNVRKQTVYIVVGDSVISPLAYADPEETKPYLTDAQVPIIWYMTSNTITEQGRILRNVALKEAVEISGGKLIKIFWIPSSGIPSEILYVKETLEIVDTIQKAKEYARSQNVTVQIGLGKMWLPLGSAWHNHALRVHRLNTAMEVVGYFWLMCRVTDLTVISMHTIERKSDKNILLHIQGLEDQHLISNHYKRPSEGGFEMTYQAGRKAREIIRRVLTRFQVEPDWEQAKKSTRTFHRIELPRAYMHGKMRAVPEPQKGVLKPEETLATRSAIRFDYLTGRISCDALPDTYLGTYPWALLCAKSTIPEFVEEMVPIKPVLSTDNRILLTRVRDEEGFMETVRAMTRNLPRQQRRTARKDAGESGEPTEAMVKVRPQPVMSKIRPQSARAARKKLGSKDQLSRKRGRSHDRFHQLLANKSRVRSTSRRPSKRARSDARRKSSPQSTARSNSVDSRRGKENSRKRAALKRSDTVSLSSSEEDEASKQVNQSVDDVRPEEEPRPRSSSSARTRSPSPGPSSLR